MFIESPIICDDCGHEHGLCRCNMSDDELYEIWLADQQAQDGLNNAWEMAGF